MWEDVNINFLTCSFFRFPTAKKPSKSSSLRGRFCWRDMSADAGVCDWGTGKRGLSEMLTLNSHTVTQSESKQRPIPIVHGNLLPSICCSRFRKVLNLGYLFVLVFFLRIVPLSKATICKNNLWTCLPNSLSKQIPSLKLTVRP